MAPNKYEFYFTRFAFDEQKALGKSILKVIAPMTGTWGTTYVQCLDSNNGFWSVTKNELHKSWSSAMTEVEKMRAAELASLSKQMKKVQDKTFTKPE